MGKKRIKAIIRKVKRKPRKDVWYMKDLSRGDILSNQFKNEALKLKRKGIDCILWWNKERADPKLHPFVRDPRWELWCKRKR